MYENQSTVARISGSFNESDWKIKHTKSLGELQEKHTERGLFMNKLEIGEQKKNALIILVGPPASGKSTWGKKFAQENDCEYVSTDELRAKLGSGEGDQSVSAQAFGVARRKISDALHAGKSAMIDATSVNRKSRRDWINMGRGAGAFIIAVAFEVPKDELYRRDAQRDRHVGPEVIDRFVAKYERPTTQEVDKVIVK